MYKFFKQYNNYLLLSVLILLTFNLIKNILNIYTFIIFTILLIYFYRNNKRIFKKLVLKIFYKDKAFIRLNNKYSAAKKKFKKHRENRKTY